jgi:hypothetical protein
MKFPPSRFCLALLMVPGFAAAAPPPAGLPERHRALLKENCQSCHGPEKQKGKFRVDNLPAVIRTVEEAERWQKVLNAMNSAEMPPEEEKQPDPSKKADFLEDLAQVMVTARRTLGDQKGVIALRRLNRREYRNTLRTLLGVDLDVSELPSDTGGPAFDTVGASLFLTGNQVEQYEALAREALEEAFNLQSAATLQKKLRSEAENIHPVFLKRSRDAWETWNRAKKWIQAVDQAVAKPENAEIVAGLREIAKTDDKLRYYWHKIPGAPSPVEFGFDKQTAVNPELVYVIREDTDFMSYDDYYLGLLGRETGSYLTLSRGRGGTATVSEIRLSIPPDFPPGDYVFRVRVGATPDAPAERRFFEFGLHGFYGGASVLSTHHVSTSMDKPEVFEIPYTVTRKNQEQGHRHLYIREKGAGNPNGFVNQKIQEARKRQAPGPEVALWIDWLELERKKPAELPPGIRALGIPTDPKTPQVGREELRTALGGFIEEAYRGVKAPAGMVDRLLGIYESRKTLGASHRDSLKETLATVLSSPRFLYRAEPAENGKRRALDGLELATRLSYFLWATPPDSELRALGVSGKLFDPAVIEAQTNRLLDHPDAAHFIRPFLSQWLTLDRLDLFQFSQSLYPKFDAAVKTAARQEVYETFGALLRENGPLNALLKADYVVINALLAQYYGIEGVHGDAFRKVPVPAESPRGGLLGMAAIMAMGSNGERTNPVERGAWVLRKMLNEPPPPAPANVPEITRLAGKLLTTRDRIKAHQEEPQCASCHRKIDPIGFGLENFDATGQWRTKETYQAVDAAGKPDPKARKTWIIETASVFHKGPAFKDYFEMRDIIAQKRDGFARGFSSALVEYALGRPCGFSDEPLIENLVAQAREKDFATRTFIHALIRSKEFQTK